MGISLKIFSEDTCKLWRWSRYLVFVRHSLSMTDDILGYGTIYYIRYLLQNITSISWGLIQMRKLWYFGASILCFYFIDSECLTKTRYLLHLHSLQVSSERILWDMPMMICFFSSSSFRCFHLHINPWLGVGCSWLSIT